MFAILTGISPFQWVLPEMKKFLRARDLPESKMPVIHHNHLTKFERKGIYSNLEVYDLVEFNKKIVELNCTFINKCGNNILAIVEPPEFSQAFTPPSPSYMNFVGCI